MTRVLAGAGRAEIDLRVGVLPFDGFDEVLHQLHARALALDDGAVRVVVVVLELTSLPDWAVDRYRGLVARAAGTSLDNVVVAASHTFSAPHLPSAQGSGAAADAFRHAIDRAVVRASSSAVAALAPANVTFGRGQSRVNVCRDVLTPAGWWLGADDAGPTNDDLPVLRFERDDGATVALLAAYGVQSSVLDGSRTSAGRRLVSSDLFGAASRHVERTIGGDAVVLLLPGAAGDQAPVVAAVRQVPAPDGRISISDAGAAAHPLVELLGQRLGDQLGRAAAAAGPVDAAPIGIRRFRVEVPAQVLPARREALRPTRSHRYVPDGMTTEPVAVLRVGSVRLVGVRPELNARSGLQLRERTGDRVVLATLVDGGSKYMADAGSYDRMTYEAMNSRFAQGSAELLVDAIAEVVNVDRGLDMVTAPSGAEPTAGPPSRRTPTSKVD